MGEVGCVGLLEYEYESRGQEQWTEGKSSRDGKALVAGEQEGASWKSRGVVSGWEGVVSQYIVQRGGGQSAVGGCWAGWAGTEGARDACIFGVGRRV